MRMPIFHSELAPEGRVIDSNAWSVYKAEGWVDSPDKLPAIEPTPEEPPVYAQWGTPSDRICMRCGAAKHKGFCKKADKDKMKNG